MVRRLLLAYAAIILGPMIVAGAAFALRDRLARRNPLAAKGNGHAGVEALEHTVEEVPAPG